MPSGEGGSMKLCGDSAMDVMFWGARADFGEGVDEFGGNNALWARFRRRLMKKNIFGPNVCQGLQLPPIDCCCAKWKMSAKEYGQSYTGTSGWLGAVT